MINTDYSSSLILSGSLEDLEKRAQRGFAVMARKAYPQRNTLESDKELRGQGVRSTNSDTDMDNELSTNEKAEVTKLQKRDLEVKAHERAHIAVGGSLVRGGANYSYTTGPDDKRYAVSGEVSIDTSPVQDDPKATISKGEHIKRAALAPAKPSSQDYAVASAASRMIMQARMDLARQEMQGAGTTVNTTPSSTVHNAYSTTSDLNSNSIYRDIVI